MRIVDDFCADTILAFARDAIEPGSTIRTDGLNSDLTLAENGYVHDRVVQRTAKQRTAKETASELLPGVRRVVSRLKRWLWGTRQGAVSSQHLGDDLDEFAFRLNRRMSHHRGKLFYRLMQQAVAMEATPYHPKVSTQYIHPQIDADEVDLITLILIK